jgi:hypothetical protein
MMVRWSVVALVGLVGCASAPDADRTSTVPSGAEAVTAFGDAVIERYVDARGTHHRLAADVDAVWTAVREAYAELEIPVGTFDAGNRRIGNASFGVRRSLAGEPLSRFFDCGARVVGGTMANTHRLEVDMMTRVVAEGEGSRLETQLRAVAYPVGTSTRPSDCVSRGALEDRLAEAVTRRLAAAEG